MSTNKNFGLYGLGVMGSNLARNITSKGWPLVVFNRSENKTTKLVQQYPSANLIPAYNLNQFIQEVQTPRVIMLMVDNSAIEEILESLFPLLSKDDSIIDLGNANYSQTKIRWEMCQRHEINYTGCGVSGGFEGALNGPSMMFGGTEEEWLRVRELFDSISAKDFAGRPCAARVGDTAAGHYSKMVHNGIEYALLQIIAEGFELLKGLYNLAPDELAKVFKSINTQFMESYLLEATEDVLKANDPLDTSKPLITRITDRAEQKGTGLAMARESLDLNLAIPSIIAGIEARFISADAGLRTRLAKEYQDLKLISAKKLGLELEEFVTLLQNTLEFAFLCAYTQGFYVMQKKNQLLPFINISEVSRIWQGGCIIRSKFLEIFERIYSRDGVPEHPFEDNVVHEMISKRIGSVKDVIALGYECDIALPAISSGFIYFDYYTQSRLPTYLVQGVRDRFGLHGFEIEGEEGEFHGSWIN